MLAIVRGRHLQAQQPATGFRESADRTRRLPHGDVLQNALTHDEVVRARRPPAGAVGMLVPVAAAGVLADVDAVIGDARVSAREPVAPVTLAGADVEHRTDRDPPPRG